MGRDLILVAISLLVWGIGEGMFFFFQPLYLQEMGVDPIAIGGILGLVGFSMAVVHIPAGYISDRYGRRSLLWLAWILGTAATGIMALSSSLAWYVIGMVIYGFTAFVAGPLSSYVTTARRNMSVGAALTFTSAAFNAGAIIGPYLGGVIGQNSGLKQTFYFSSLTFLVSTIILFFIRPQPVENTDHHSPITALKSVANPHFLKFLTLAFITFLFMYLPQPLSQNFLRSERGYGLIDIGILLSLRSLGIVVFNLGIGRLPLGLGIMLSHAGMALATFLLWQVSGAAAYKTAYFLFGIYQTKRILTNANARELVETKNMGIAYGLVETVGAVVIIVGPPLAGFLYSINPTLPFSLSFFMILSFLMFDLFFRRKAKSGISMDKIPD